MSVDGQRIIRQFFSQCPRSNGSLENINDSGMVSVRTHPGEQTAIALDTLVAGVHFDDRARPADIGYKALAVNLSDLAAMGATPLAATLSVVLPEEDPRWLREFSEGICTTASGYHTDLACLQVCQGPLAVTVQVYGAVPEGAALLRSGARPGDAIFVTGTLGDAGLALGSLRGDIQLPAGLADMVMAALDRPVPRLQAGVALRKIASSAIDISDGLLADLGHILEGSQAGAVIHVGQLPLSQAFTTVFNGTDGRTLALSAGDDYELCFTVPQDKLLELESAGRQFACQYTRIGEITSGTELLLLENDGSHYETSVQGYDHFG